MISHREVTVLSKLAEFFPDCADIEHATLDSLRIDSFALIELILALESAFGFEFEDSVLDLDAFQTLGQLALYVERRTLNGSD